MPSAANVKTVWIMSVTAATDARNALRSVRNVPKNVLPARMKKSAADAMSARIVSAATETSAITAKPARCVRNTSVYAAADARNVQKFVPNS